MKALIAIILPALFVGGLAAAQTNTNPAPAFVAPSDNPVYQPPPVAPKPHVVDVPQPDQPSAPYHAPTTPPADHVDPAKVAEYQKRFQVGYALEQAGKLAEARQVYDSILADEPQAKRSLLEAGKISFKLGELARADEYLEKLHELVPTFPEAIELLIQVNQALGHDVKVELLVRDFIQLHNSGALPDLTRSICFVRERMHDGLQDIIVSQFFNPTQEPNTVWMAEVFDPTGLLTKRILLNYDDEATRALRAKDAKYAKTQVFTWFGHQITDGKVTQVDAYLQIFALPDYRKFRSAMEVILANPPKPIYSAPVKPAEH